MSEALNLPEAPRRLTEKPEWSELLETALTMPGSMGSTYNRFYNYSFGNQILLFMQGVEEPVNTYKRWAAMNRQVLRGSKAKAIMLPLITKVRNDEGELEQRVTGFKLMNCLFGLSETEGEELPPYEPAEWSKERALGALGIREVAFQHPNGNTQGYSIGNEIAINPVAAYPFKTLWHEMGHVVLKHTTDEGLEVYQEHRGVQEFQAESVAYLGMNELGATDQFDPSESRAYIQHWIRKERPPEPSIRQVFTATDRILSAGRAALSSLDSTEQVAHSSGQE